MMFVPTGFFTTRHQAINCIKKYQCKGTQNNLIKVSVSYTPNKYNDITTSADSERHNKKEGNQETKPVSSIAPSKVNHMVSQWRAQT